MSKGQTIALVEFMPDEYCPVVAITPMIRWALETIVIHSVPSAPGVKQDHRRARDELAKWMDGIHPRVIDRSLEQHKEMT